jgi:hypothetical protein
VDVPFSLLSGNPETSYTLLMVSVHIFDGSSVHAHEVPAARPLRGAAWRPDGRSALLVGNRGLVVRFDGQRFDVLSGGGAQNLRGAAWAPAADQALLVGNRGAVILFEADRFQELPTATAENLRRVAWAPDGQSALIVGNSGCVLRYDAQSGTLLRLAGDRAHTMRSVAWRPDGAYALIGAYASPNHGYPSPFVLYRCDGRYVQGILATDDEDDAIAIDWQPGADPARALVLVSRYGPGDEGLPGKIMSYDGSGYSYRTIPRFARAAGNTAGFPGDVVTLLGVGWHPSGEYAVLCGERGKLLTYDGTRMRLIATGTRDSLIGPFWQPAVASPMALMLQGPVEKMYTV